MNNQIPSNQTPDKPRMKFWGIWNMSFGFLGVQYAFGLQQANMSPIYRYLGADESSIPILWLAGPITGLVVQPIVGAMSDRTWHPRLGRRRPYFLVGAILTSVALVLMPYSSAVWMAAALMWLLDGAANVTMEPFRAFIADKLPEEQRTLGFAVQSFFVGFGQTLANLMPFILVTLGIALTTTDNGIPDFVKYSFVIGALTLLVTIAWTIQTTDEDPPADMEAFRREHQSTGLASKILGSFTEVFAALRQMPVVMRQLWWVKFFTWYGLPLMWQYLSLSIARHCFNAPTAQSAGFDEGVRWGNLGLATFNVACFASSFLLPAIARHISHRATHALCLTIGGVGFISMLLTNNPSWVLGGMVLVGIAWASIMAMPYVMLSTSVPARRMGVYMGIFNMFIVIPQIINMITVPLLYDSILGSDPRHALVLAGVCMIAAAASCFLVSSTKPQQSTQA
jgi:maltose/moltooligosaccharide transporter